MDLIFPSRRPSSSRVLSHASTEEYLDSHPVVGTKRHREATGGSERVLTGAAAERFSTLLQCYHFGNRPWPASEALAAVLPSSAFFTASSPLATPDRDAHLRQECDILLSSLHLMLKILCELTSRDKAGYFRQHPSPPLEKLDGKEVTTIPAPNDEPSALVKLYCGVNAVLLEIDDLWRSPTFSEKEWSGMAACARSMIDSFERTLLCDVLLSLHHRPPTPSLPSFLAYTAELLDAGFMLNAWPTQILPPTSHSCAPTDARMQRMGGSLRKEIWPDTGAMDGPTVILVRALETLREADSLHILGCPSSPTPITADVAARHDDITSLKISFFLTDKSAFHVVLMRAYAGVYRQLGLSRALVDVQATILQVLHRQDDSEIKQKFTISSPEAYSSALWEEWCRAVTNHYNQFLSSALKQPQLKVLMPGKPSVFTVTSERRSAVINEVQAAALRVLKFLREQDPQSWFSSPTFELPIADFSSLETWVSSTTFSNKTPLQAFHALRLTLDCVVDICVQHYGPTHQYSAALTSIRKLLVFAAKKEQLL